MITQQCMTYGLFYGKPHQILALMCVHILLALGPLKITTIRRIHYYLKMVQYLSYHQFAPMTGHTSCEIWAAEKRSQMYRITRKAKKIP